MNIFKALFGGSEESPEEKQKAEESRRFDMFKYDGVKAAKIGQVDYAVKCYREALAIHEDLEVRDYLAQALIRTGELAEAREHLGVLADAEPENAAVHLLTAQVAYMQEDYEAMAAACEKAMAADKENARAHYLYAQAYVGQGNPVGAIAMLTKAIALNGDMGEAWLLRGRTLLSVGDVNGADADANHLMDVAPENEDVLLLKARVEHKRGNADAAIDIYNKVTEVNPFCVDAFRERGAIRYEKGDMDGAKADMQTVLELEPEKVADINGEYSAEGVEHKVRQAYSNINPLGL